MADGVAYGGERGGAEGARAWGEAVRGETRTNSLGRFTAGLVSSLPGLFILRSFTPDLRPGLLSSAPPGAPEGKTRTTGALSVARGGGLGILGNHQLEGVLLCHRLTL